MTIFEIGKFPWNINNMIYTYMLRCLWYTGRKREPYNTPFRMNYTIFKKPIPKAIYTYSNVTTKIAYFLKKLVISIIKLNKLIN